jgi:hypothetical protein
MIHIPLNVNDSNDDIFQIQKNNLPQSNILRSITILDDDIWNNITQLPDESVLYIEQFSCSDSGFNYVGLFKLYKGNVSSEYSVGHTAIYPTNLFKFVDYDELTAILGMTPTINDLMYVIVNNMYK